MRAAVGLPVLAKEFVVDPRQLPLLRSAGADLVLLLSSLHPARRLRDLVRRAVDIGLEPLVEAHDERELEAALATEARLIGLNNRDLRSLAVDTERAMRMRDLVPDDRLVIAESGVREAAMVAELRAAGFDAALVGEALMRAVHPRAAVETFVTAGAVPDDPAAAARLPFVKICGVTDEAGVLACVRTGVDAIGLNLVAGTPRQLSLDDAAALARLARAAAPAGRAPRIVAVTADAPGAELALITATVAPDAIQLCGSEPPESLGRLARPAWKVLALPPGPVEGPEGEPAPGALSDGLAAATVERVRAYRAAGAERILLDAAGGLHPGGTGLRISTDLAAAVAREVPVVLAGGLGPATVAEAMLAVPAVGVDVSSGVEVPRVPGERPRKDTLRVALFAKRARAARFDRPHISSRPTPVPQGLLEADERGRWGLERDFGGRYVPETLIAALEALEGAWFEVRHDPRFWARFSMLLRHYAGRPTPLYRADRIAAEALEQARQLDPMVRLPEKFRLYLKREDLAHTGAHKINNALGQALLTRRLGKSRVIAETGAGQHGVATATACALLGLPCVVYMGAEDIRRQAPNVLRMEALGTEVRPVHSGTATLKDAVNEAMRDWVTNVETTHYVLGSAMGPHPYPTIVRDLQRVIGDEAAVQVEAAEGRLPDIALACVGGGSNALGLLSRFIGEPAVQLAVAEAAGEGIATGRHAAALLGGSPGILHGSRSMMLQDRDGQVVEAVSISAGLDYPGIGPQLSALMVAGRLQVDAAIDVEAVAAVRWLACTEGILPALEAAHALAVLPRLLVRLATAGRLPDETVLLLGLSGRGDKDLAALALPEVDR